MRKSFQLVVVLLLGLFAACTTSVELPDTVLENVVSESATIEQYEIQGVPTGLVHLALPFVQSSPDVIVNVVADLNDDGSFDESERVVTNSPALAKSGHTNRYAFAAESLPTSVNLRVYTTTEPIDSLPDTFTAATASVGKVNVDDTIAVSAPGAQADLKRGSFIPLVSAHQDGETEREGDIPDLGGGPMDCFPVATANNLISLANTHGIRDQLPADPKDMVDEMKQDMQFNNGVLIQNYQAGKQAFVDRHNLPIITTRKNRPTTQDIEDALAEDCAIEISTTFLRSKSGKDDTGHVLTGVGISVDGDDIRLMVNDPATSTSSDVYETSMTGGDSPFILIKDYPFWDGIMIVDTLFIQCWDDNLAIRLGYDLESVDEEPIGSVGGIEGASQTIDTLVIGGKHYPKTQFRIGSHADAGCAGDHWHADGEVYSVESPETGITDPLPNNCGFGIVGTVPEETIDLTHEQATRWIGSILSD